jgi:hypothetical protein
MGPFGIGLGMALAQFFVDNNPNPVEGLEQIIKMNSFYFYFGTISLLPTFLFYRDKPAQPPRYTFINLNKFK